MDYLKLFKSRHHSVGDNRDDGIVKSSKRSVANSFSNSLFSEIVLINGVETEAVVTQEKKSEDKTLLVKPDIDAHTGSIVTIKEVEYIVLDFLGEGIHEIYPTAKLKQCNTHFKLSGKKEQQQIGVDDLKRPVYKDVEVTPDQYIPCFAEYRVYFLDNRNPINIPSNIITITLPYTEHKDVGLGENFDVFGEDYHIVNVDRTKSINGKGLLILTGQRK